MALFNKLENFARNLGDKTSDVIETGRLNAKINSEKSLAAEEWKKIGEFYYNLFASGGESGVAPEVLEACESAKAHLDAAAEAQAEIDRIKAEKEAEEQARAAAYEAEKAAAESAASGTITCPECGAAVAEGKKFCGECGTKIEIPIPEPEPEGITCPECGAPIAEGKKFCGECGTKIEAPAEEPAKPKTCPECGAEIAEGRKFCGECGTKIE